MKVLTIVGARPQFIKAAVVSRALEGKLCEEVVVHTGQHYDTNMNDVFFSELDLPTPRYQLGIGSASHGAQTGRMLEAIERVISTERPDVVLVYGDTNSTAAGALAAVKLHVPVAHVEAGLRSFNRRMPEEINRVLADHISSILFAPSQFAADQLTREGIPSDRITLVGDVMYDAVLFYGERAASRSTILSELELMPKGYVLVTVHRADNTDVDSTLWRIATELQEVAEHTKVVWPMHPRTRDALNRIGGLHLIARAISVIAPVGYLDMTQLERHAAVIITDSGGVQKEAFFHRVPCVTVRDETEWKELVESGWNRLAPVSNGTLASTVASALIAPEGDSIAPYGDGRAGLAIANRIVDGRLDL